MFEKEFHDHSLNEIIEAKKMSEDIEVSEFAKKVFCGIEGNRAKIDDLIERNIVGWNKDRLSKVTISILRIAIYEMIFEELIPISVSINEAVELAKKYGTSEDAAFVNGVLGTIAKDIS
jgi:N utilization substance protein B